MIFNFVEREWFEHWSETVCDWRYRSLIIAMVQQYHPAYRLQGRSSKLYRGEHNWLTLPFRVAATATSTVYTENKRADDSWLVPVWDIKCRLENRMSSDPGIHDFYRHCGCVFKDTGGRNFWFRPLITYCRVAMLLLTALLLLWYANSFEEHRMKDARVYRSAGGLCLFRGIIHWVPTSNFVLLGLLLETTRN